MAKKTVQKRKWKIKNILFYLLFLVVVIFVAYFFFQLPIQNIVIKNTTYLEDDYILELAGIKNYPSFVLTTHKEVEDSLEKSNYIKKAVLKKKMPFLFEITIMENCPLFSNIEGKIVLEDGTLIENDFYFFRLPRLMNEVPEEKYEKFLTEMSKINEDVSSKISDIEYQPNEYDEDRFLLYMDDGNMVYLTLTKFKMINHYNEVLKQLENHKGILYLDNGNHFQIKE